MDWSIHEPSKILKRQPHQESAKGTWQKNQEQIGGSI